MEINQENQWMTKLLLWILGGWFFASLCMMFVAIGNFKVLKPQNLRNSAFVYQDISAGEERDQALKYAASELNRYFFGHFNLAQVVVAFIAVVIFLLSQRRSNLALASLILSLGISLAFVLYFTPTLLELGRKIDFMPRNPEPQEVQQFFFLHKIDVALEMMKLLLLFLASISLFNAPKKIIT